jgi:hypothetical protein
VVKQLAPRILPMRSACLKKVKRSHDIGTYKVRRANDASVHVAFRGKMNHYIWVIPLKNFLDAIVICDIRPLKAIVFFLIYVFKVTEVSGIGEFIQVDERVLLIFGHEDAQKIRTDKACSACNQDFHLDTPL